MIGIKLKGNTYGSTILYTKRPWIKKPVVSVRVYVNATVFWCQSVEQQSRLSSFLKNKGLDAELFNHNNREPENVEYSMNDSRKLQDMGIGCSLNYQINTKILEELEENIHLLLDPFRRNMWVLR